MSALPLKADMFSVRNDVRLVPLADIAATSSRGVTESRKRYAAQPDAERYATGQSGGLASCRASTLAASALDPFARSSRRRRSPYSEAKRAIRRHKSA